MIVIVFLIEGRRSLDFGYCRRLVWMGSEEVGWWTLYVCVFVFWCPAFCFGLDGLSVRPKIVLVGDGYIASLVFWVGR